MEEQQIYPTPTENLVRWTLELTVIAADISNYCDHAEHIEETDRRSLVHAADGMQQIAIEVAEELEVDLITLYRSRLAAIEERNAALHISLLNMHSCEAQTRANGATTWRELQLAQIEHDRFYHPDVIGLQKIERLRHYAFHATKLAGAFAIAAGAQTPAGDYPPPLDTKRLADLLLFSITLHTLLSVVLPEEPLPYTKA